MAAEVRLPILELPGLSPDSLGNYLASLGLLRLLSQKWPSTRIAWRDEVLHVVGGPPSLDELLDELVRVANERAWTPYLRDWAAAQKKSSELAQKPKTRASSGVPFALWQGEAAENLLDGFTAHVVAHGAGRSMNPILGRAGKIGQRDFAKGWARATELLTAPQPSKPGKTETPAKKQVREKSDAKVLATETARKRGELNNLLHGGPISWLVKDLNAATWFSHANKLYNNGQRAFRDGVLSPWLMALACEGVSFLCGGPSRRLGSRARAVGAFPFVTRAAAAETSGQADRDTAELWAPTWGRPMTIAEVVALFRRGRAELASRAAQTPAAFAAAILRRGVDAGVVEFRRFVLGWTTAQDYVEPRFQGTAATASSSSSTGGALATALERVTMLLEHRGFPRDGKRFAGIRGPIEVAILALAAEPSRPEVAIALLDATTKALDRVDRNRSFRAGRVRWEPLPLEWLPSLFADERPTVEARLALSVVSSFPVAKPFATYRFGVEWSFGRYEHTERPPSRWVWGPGPLARVLGTLLSRRLLDQATADAGGRPEQGRAPLPATTAHIHLWLTNEIDEPLLARWLSRLALFDWRRVPHQVRELPNGPATAPRVDGALALLGLMQPLVDQRALVVQSLSQRDLLSDETGARTTAAARSLITMIRSGDVDSAVRLAGSRYAMAGARLASFGVPWRAHDTDRLVAALLFTLSDRDRAVLFERWLRPRRRQQGDHAHV